MESKRYLPAIPPEPLFITTDFWKLMMKYQQYYNAAWIKLQIALDKQR